MGAVDMGLLACFGEAKVGATRRIWFVLSVSSLAPEVSILTSTFTSTARQTRPYSYPHDTNDPLQQHPRETA